MKKVLVTIEVILQFTTSVFADGLDRNRSVAKLNIGGANFKGTYSIENCESAHQHAENIQGFIREYGVLISRVDPATWTAVEYSRVGGAPFGKLKPLLWKSTEHPSGTNENRSSGRFLFVSGFCNRNSSARKVDFKLSPRHGVVTLSLVIFKSRWIVKGDCPIGLIEPGDQY